MKKIPNMQINNTAGQVMADETQDYNDSLAYLMLSLTSVMY